MGLNFAQLSRDASAAVGSLKIFQFVVSLSLVVVGVFLVGCDSYVSCFIPQAAARRLSTQKKDIEVVESVGVSGKSDFKRTVKYFRAEVTSSMLNW